MFRWIPADDCISSSDTYNFPAAGSSKIWNSVRSVLFAKCENCFGQFFDHYNENTPIFPFEFSTLALSFSGELSRVKIEPTWKMHYRSNLIGKLTPQAIQKLFHFRTDFFLSIFFSAEPRSKRAPHYATFQYICIENARTNFARDEKFSLTQDFCTAVCRTSVRDRNNRYDSNERFFLVVVLLCVMWLHSRVIYGTKWHDWHE